MTNEKKSPLNSSYAKYSGIAFQMFAIIAIGAFGGVKLDEYLNNQYTIIFSLVAVLAAIFFVIRQILKMSKDDNAS